MTDSPVAAFYGGEENLAEVIADSLRKLGKDIGALKTDDLNMVDAFHIRGRKAPLELAAKMNLGKNWNVLDVGSGLGGPARTLAEDYSCRVTGVDLTGAFCDAAKVLSN